MIRIFVEPFTGDAVELGKEHLHYLTRVMRLGDGATIKVLDNSGTAFTCRLEGKQAIVEGREAVPEAPVAVTLYQALPKADKLDWILQKATELGVARIVPLVAARSVAQVKGDKLEAKLERWTKLVTEAAEQSERGRIPEVLAPIEPSKVDLAPGEWAFVLAERGKNLSLPASLPPTPPAAVSLFIGPEGGWTPDELELLAAAGARPVTLGPRILRTETAALAAVTLVMGRYEL
jgi:16S rRNA (uracil1498-N3)-methyltransferase